MVAMRSFRELLDDLFARIRRRSPAPSTHQYRDDRVTFAEIITASAILDLGDIPVDLLSRRAANDRAVKPEGRVADPRIDRGG
jgi:hypothetical protein